MLLFGRPKTGDTIDGSETMHGSVHFSNRHAFIDKNVSMKRALCSLDFSEIQVTVYSVSFLLGRKTGDTLDGADTINGDTIDDGE